MLILDACVFKMHNFYKHLHYCDEEERKTLRKCSESSVFAIMSVTKYVVTYTLMYFATKQHTEK
jgi:hypothetical protein